MFKFYKEYKGFCRVFLTLGLISILAKWSYSKPSSLFIDELMLLFQAEFHFERLLNFIFKFSYHPIIYFFVLKVFTLGGVTISYIKFFSYICHLIIGMMISSFGKNNQEQSILFLIVLTNVYLNAYSLVISSYIFSMTMLSLFLFYHFSKKEYPRLELILFGLNLYTNYMTGFFIFLILLFKYYRGGLQNNKSYILSLSLISLPLIYTSPLRGVFFDRYSKVGASGFSIEKVSLHDPQAIMIEVLPFVVMFSIYMWGVFRNKLRDLIEEDKIFFIFVTILLVALLYMNQIYIRYFALLIPFLILRIYMLGIIKHLLIISILSFFILSPHQVSYYDNQKIDKLFEVQELKEASENKLHMISYNPIWYRYYFRKINKNVFEIIKKPLSISNQEVLNLLRNGEFVFCIKYECPVSLLELRNNDEIHWEEGKDFIFIKSNP